MTEIDISNKVCDTFMKVKKIILLVEVNLTRDEILETLKHSSIKINGLYYSIPEKKLIDCLMSRQYRNIRLELEQLF